MSTYRILVISSLLGTIFLFQACLSLIDDILIPSQVVIDREFVVAVDGSVIGHGGGMVGLVVQIPESVDFIAASYVGPSVRRILRRNANIAARYRAEQGHVVIAVADSIVTTRDTHGDVRVLLRFVAREAGSATFKFIAGTVQQGEKKLHWQSTDPVGIRDFADLDDERVVRQVHVRHPERNGTAAIELASHRQYLLFPDSGLSRLPLTRDFTIETWCLTTSVDVPLFSTRTDDFNTAFPMELRVNARGEAELRCADGRHSYASAGGHFIADGGWHHLAVAWCADSSRFLLYVDGNVRDTLIVPSTMRSVTGRELLLGSNVSRTQFARANFDELRLWETCRNEQEIAYYRDLALSGYETGLYALFSFDNGTEGRIYGQSQMDSIWLAAYNRPRLIVSTAPLRIELLSFNTMLDEDTVRMSWETFDETKIRGYDVEKRTESGRYSVFEHVEPMRTPERHQIYTLTDRWSGRQIVYYRLRRINTDGTVLFSAEVPIGSEVILNFVLEDNNPNPFTETTEIHYTVSKRTRVDLTVYDIMGNEVVALVAERQEPGSYAVTFDGRELQG
ncbi:MAG: LamG domain-containing protein [Bacteroidetes bacterium]|nr:LamG domain-containing protein [Bacteroidota bacterium]